MTVGPRVTRPAARPGSRWQRVGWFVLIWAASVLVVGITAELLKRVILG